MKVRIPSSVYPQVGPSVQSAILGGSGLRMPDIDPSNLFKPDRVPDLVIAATEIPDRFPEVRVAPSVSDTPEVLWAPSELGEVRIVRRSPSRVTQEPVYEVELPVTAFERVLQSLGQGSGSFDLQPDGSLITPSGVEIYPSEGYPSPISEYVDYLIRNQQGDQYLDLILGFKPPAGMEPTLRWAALDILGKTRLPQLEERFLSMFNALYQGGRPTTLEEIQGIPQSVILQSVAQVVDGNRIPLIAYTLEQLLQDEGFSSSLLTHPSVLGARGNVGQVQTLIEKHNTIRDLLKSFIAASNEREANQIFESIWENLRQLFMDATNYTVASGGFQPFGGRRQQIPGDYLNRVRESINRAFSSNGLKSKIRELVGFYRSGGEQHATNYHGHLADAALESVLMALMLVKSSDLNGDKLASLLANIRERSDNVPRVDSDQSSGTGINPRLEFLLNGIPNTFFNSLLRAVKLVQDEVGKTFKYRREGWNEESVGLFRTYPFLYPVIYNIGAAHLISSGYLPHVTSIFHKVGDSAEPARTWVPGSSWLTSLVLGAISGGVIGGLTRLLRIHRQEGSALEGPVATALWNTALRSVHNFAVYAMESAYRPVVDPHTESEYDLGTGWEKVEAGQDAENTGNPPKSIFVGRYRETSIAMSGGLIFGSGEREHNQTFGIRRQHAELTLTGLVSRIIEQLGGQDELRRVESVLTVAQTQFAGEIISSLNRQVRAGRGTIALPQVIQNIVGELDGITPQVGSLYTDNPRAYDKGAIATRMKNIIELILQCESDVAKSNNIFNRILNPILFGTGLSQAAVQGEGQEQDGGVSIIKLLMGIKVDNLLPRRGTDATEQEGNVEAERQSTINQLREEIDRLRGNEFWAGIIRLLEGIFPMNSDDNVAKVSGLIALLYISFLQTYYEFAVSVISSIHEHVLIPKYNESVSSFIEEKKRTTGSSERQRRDPSEINPTLGLFLDQKIKTMCFFLAATDLAYDWDRGQRERKYEHSRDYILWLNYLFRTGGKGSQTDIIQKVGGVSSVPTNHLTLIHPSKPMGTLATAQSSRMFLFQRQGDTSIAVYQPDVLKQEVDTYTSVNIKHNLGVGADRKTVLLLGSVFLNSASRLYAANMWGSSDLGNPSDFARTNALLTERLVLHMYPSFVDNLSGVSQQDDVRVDAMTANLPTIVTEDIRTVLSPQYIASYAEELVQRNLPYILTDVSFDRELELVYNRYAGLLAGLGGIGMHYRPAASILLSATRGGLKTLGYNFPGLLAASLANGFTTWVRAKINQEKPEQETRTSLGYESPMAPARGGGADSLVVKGHVVPDPQLRNLFSSASAALNYGVVARDVSLPYAFRNHLKRYELEIQSGSIVRREATSMPLSPHVFIRVESVKSGEGEPQPNPDLVFSGNDHLVLENRRFSDEIFFPFPDDFSKVYNHISNVLGSLRPNAAELLHSLPPLYVVFGELTESIINYLSAVSRRYPNLTVDRVYIVPAISREASPVGSTAQYHQLLDPYVFMRSLVRRSTEEGRYEIARLFGVGVPVFTAWIRYRTDDVGGNVSEDRQGGESRDVLVTADVRLPASIILPPRVTWGYSVRGVGTRGFSWVQTRGGRQERVPSAFPLFLEALNVDYGEGINALRQGNARWLEGNPEFYDLAAISMITHTLQSRLLRNQSVDRVGFMPEAIYAGVDLQGDVEGAVGNLRLVPLNASIALSEKGDQRKLYGHYYTTSGAAYEVQQVDALSSMPLMSQGRESRPIVDLSSLVSPASQVAQPQEIQGFSSRANISPEAGEAARVLNNAWGTTFIRMVNSTTSGDIYLAFERVYRRFVRDLLYDDWADLVSPASSIGIVAGDRTFTLGDLVSRFVQSVDEGRGIANRRLYEDLRVLAGEHDFVKTSFFSLVVYELARRGIDYMDAFGMLLHLWSILGGSQFDRSMPTSPAMLPTQTQNLQAQERSLGAAPASAPTSETSAAALAEPARAAETPATDEGVSRANAGTSRGLTPEQIEFLRREARGKGYVLEETLRNSPLFEGVEFPLPGAYHLRQGYVVEGVLVVRHRVDPENIARRPNWGEPEPTSVAEATSSGPARPAGQENQGDSINPWIPGGQIPEEVFARADADSATDHGTGRGASGENEQNAESEDRPADTQGAAQAPDSATPGVNRATVLEGIAAQLLSETEEDSEGAGRVEGPVRSADGSHGMAVGGESADIPVEPIEKLKGRVRALAGQPARVKDSFALNRDKFLIIDSVRLDSVRVLEGGTEDGWGNFNTLFNHGLRDQLVRMARSNWVGNAETLVNNALESIWSENGDKIEQKIESGYKAHAGVILIIRNPGAYRGAGPSHWPKWGDSGGLGDVLIQKLRGTQESEVEGTSFYVPDTLLPVRSASRETVAFALPFIMTTRGEGLKTLEQIFQNALDSFLERLREEGVSAAISPMTYSYGIAMIEPFPERPSGPSADLDDDLDPFA